MPRCSRIRTVVIWASSVSDRYRPSTARHIMDAALTHKPRKGNFERGSGVGCAKPWSDHEAYPRHHRGVGRGCVAAHLAGVRRHRAFRDVLDLGRGRFVHAVETMRLSSHPSPTSDVDYSPCEIQSESRSLIMRSQWSAC